MNYLRFIVIIIWGAKVVKNHELCKSLLHFITTLPNNMLQNLRDRRGLVTEIACD